MNVLLFIMTLMISFIVVRAGAVAFEMTGLEWSLAKFQALSCFSGTGFTTKESELITGHPQRRKIASILMVLGNAGLVTLIATFANSMRVDSFLPQIKLPFLHVFIPAGAIPVLKLIIIVLFILLMYRLIVKTPFAVKITDIIRRHIVKNELVHHVSFEELLISTGGYGISSVAVEDGSEFDGKSLRNASLRANDVTLLAIERKAEIIPHPHADEKIFAGDILICFGKLDVIKDIFRNKKRRE